MMQTTQKNSLPPVWPAFWGLFHRDLQLAFRKRAEIVNNLLFFVLVVSLFPLGITPESKLLLKIAPGIIWVAALLATLMNLEGLFRSDFEDGSLEQLLLTAHPLSLLILAKVLAHWLVTGLPLILMTPLLGLLLHLPLGAVGVLMITLALGTPILGLVGAIGMALTIGLRRGGVLLSLLVLPLYIPVLIFATGATNAALAGLPTIGPIYLLGAMLFLSLSVAPLAISASLRVSLS